MFRTKQAAEQLLIAVKLKKLSEISRLVKCGVDVNAPIDKSGKTCLHYAVCEGDLRAVKALIEAGANLNTKDEDGHTPLHRAMVDGHTTVMKLLVDAGSSLDAVDENGNTALHEAAWNGYSQCADILVTANSNVNLHNKTGYSPLHLAAQNGHMSTVQMLLKGGSYPMSKNNYGDTPLHIAVRYGHPEMTQALIDAGVNVSDQNNEGNTPLHIAAQLGHSQIVDILLDGGSTIAVRNNVGDTARDIAMQNCFKDIVKMIPCTKPSKAKDKNEKETARHLFTDTTSTFATTNTLLYVPRPEPGNPVPKKPWQRKEYLKFLSWRSKKEEESNMTKPKMDLPPLKYEEMCSIEKEFSSRSINRRSNRNLKRSKEIQEKRKSSGFYSEPALEVQGESQQEQDSTATSREQVSEDIRVSKDKKNKEKGFFSLFRSASDTDLRSEPKKKSSFFGRKLWDKLSTSTKETEEQRGSSKIWEGEDNELEQTRKNRTRESKRRSRKHHRDCVECGDNVSEEREERARNKERKHRRHKEKSRLESDQSDSGRRDGSTECHSPRLRHRSHYSDAKHDNRADKASRHKGKGSDDERRREERKKRHRRESETDGRSKSRERTSRRQHNPEHAHSPYEKDDKKSRSKSKERRSRRHSDSEQAQLEKVESKSRSKSTGRRPKHHSDSEHAHLERFEKSRSKDREKKHSHTEPTDFDLKERNTSLRRSTSRKDKEKTKKKNSQTQTCADAEVPVATLVQVGAVPCHVVSARCETCSSSMRSFEARQEQCASEIDTTRRALEHRLKRLEEKFDKQFSSTEKLRKEQETREKYEYERIVCRVTDECREVNKNLKQEADEIKTDVLSLISDHIENLEDKVDRMATSSTKKDKVSHAFMFMGSSKNGKPREKLTQSSPVIGRTNRSNESLTDDKTVLKMTSSIKNMSTQNNVSPVRVSRSQALDTLQDPTVREHSLTESTGSSDIDRREGRSDHENNDVVKCNETFVKNAERVTSHAQVNDVEISVQTETLFDGHIV